MAPSPRPHWVIAELDVNGAIDRHAAMCLTTNIADALTTSARPIIVDLRDLSSIDAAGLDLFVQAHARCYAHGVELELLISGDASHHAIADALDSAGLLDQLNFTWDPARRVPARPHLVRL
jgi:anti-anti-sigma factor